MILCFFRPDDALKDEAAADATTAAPSWRDRSASIFLNCADCPRSIESARGKRTAPEQLQQVVSQTHEFPFPLHLLKASQAEIAKPERLFDLTEHRFDDHLSPSVFRSLCFWRPVAMNAASIRSLESTASMFSSLK